MGPRVPTVGPVGLGSLGSAPMALAGSPALTLVLSCGSGLRLSHPKRAQALGTHVPPNSQTSPFVCSLSRYFLSTCCVLEVSSALQNSRKESRHGPALTYRGPGVGARWCHSETVRRPVWLARSDPGENGQGTARQRWQGQVPGAVRAAVRSPALLGVLPKPLAALSRAVLRLKFLCFITHSSTFWLCDSCQDT